MRVWRGRMRLRGLVVQHVRFESLRFESLGRRTTIHVSAAVFLRPISAGQFVCCSIRVLLRPISARS